MLNKQIERRNDMSEFLFNVMNKEPNFPMDTAREVLKRPLQKEWIKQIEIGGKKLDYIEGARVINILNEAFDYKWSFRVISYEIIQAETYKTKDGKEYPQGKYALVLGELTVLGLGVKTAFGSKPIVGRTSEQESVMKAAATDALKKCATMFGIAEELYIDDIEPAADNANTPKSTREYNNFNVSNPPQQTTKAPASTYNPEDVEKLKEYKALLGIVDNKQLDNYVKDWSGAKLTSYKDIKPNNISMFLAYLRTKIES